MSILVIYIIRQVTCGGLVYRALKNEVTLGRKSHFYRILPRGESLDVFPFDELDISAMIKVTAFDRSVSSIPHRILYRLRESLPSKKYGNAFPVLLKIMIKYQMLSCLEST